MTPTEKQDGLSSPTPGETPSTWHDLAGHWLRTLTEKPEIEVLARREAALQRWRGMLPETPTRF